MTASSKPRANQEPAPRSVPALMLGSSARAALLGVDILQSNLDMWRSVMDVMRDSVRTQQDAMLNMLQSRMSDRVPPAPAEISATAGEGGANGTSDFLTPMLAARRAYVQMSGAMVNAQRETLSALIRQSQPH